MAWKTLGVCIPYVPYPVLLPCHIYPLRSVQEPKATVFMCINSFYKIPTGGHSDTDSTLPILRNFLLIDSFPSVLKEFIVTFRLRCIPCFYLWSQTIVSFPHVHYVIRWPSCFFRWVDSEMLAVLCCVQNRCLIENERRPY